MSREYSNKLISKGIVYLLGVFITIFLWWLVTANVDGSLNRFSPLKTISALARLLEQQKFWEGLLSTLLRLMVGLLLATVIGVPVGLAVGYLPIVSSITYIPFQFVRMISPLSWTPVAIILFGLGSGPVYFLIAIAAVWPIIINTAAGIKAADKKWIELAKVQGGSDWEIIKFVLFRASLPHILTGIQLALGVAWIVLVPAEMLGVASGLGYMILDFRDANDYGSIMAVILIIGLCGLLSDMPLRILIRRVSWQ
jgi:NitT/TauT family transport system permease protein